MDADADLRALVTLQRAAYRIEAQLIGVPTLPALHERPSALRASGELALGAEAGGRLVGAITWKRSGDTVDIHRLVVDPATFRQGIASALLARLAEEEPDARRTIVDAATRNHPAVALYQARGFRRVSERTVAGGVRIIRLERPA
jgi:ribosomal protein S18 acetylase RimI-like enzyme